MTRLCFSAAFLSKLAKHLALLACLAIVGESSGRFVMGQAAILLLVVSAALLHSAARTLQRRWQFQWSTNTKTFTTETPSTQSSEYSLIKIISSATSVPPR
ncbi:MAG TPA: hypothetical protein VEG60_13550 [Candidatus Binatia bacterium]|nr:hypothetical protein [Candidatus Binatia bacterium]